MKLPTLSLALVLALFCGALIGVTRKPGSSSAPATSPAKVGLRSPAVLSPEPDAADEATASPGDTANDFAKLPRAAHRRLPDGPEPAGPLSAEELKARKQEALEDILASIGSFPGLPEEHHERLAAYAAQLATAEAPRVQCWGPGTPPEIVHAYMRVEQKIQQAAGMQVQAFQLGNHWSQTATNGSGQSLQGTPVTIRWSIVADGTAISGTGAGEPVAPSNLRSRLTAIYGGSATGNPSAQPWFATFQTTFDNIAANTGLRFVYEPNDDGAAVASAANPGIVGVRGDIRISGHSIDGNSGILAYAYYPDNGDVVIDTNDSFFSTITNTSIRLRNVLEHELGHALGLAHVCPVNETKLMEPYVTSAFRGSQFDDIYTFQRHYGDMLEVRPGMNNNDSMATAAPLGLTLNTTASWQWLSIDDNSDSDLYSFNAASQNKITVRIIPSDPILPTNPTVNAYLEGPQATCSTGSPFDPTNQQDLVLDLLNGSGTVVASASSRPAGQTEEIVDFQLPAPGTFYIRVRGGTADRAQLYRMEALLGTAPQSPDVVISSTRLETESNAVGYQSVDSGETIRLGITLANNGNAAINNLNATLTGPTGTTIFAGTKSYGSIAAGTSAEQLFTFALSGNAGEVKTLQLALSGSGYSSTLPLTFTLGTMLANTSLDEHFDTIGSLPFGWSQSVTQQAAPWTVSDNFAKGPPGSAFAPAVERNGDATLMSPTVPIPPAGILEFAHRFDLDDKLDGAVLEAKIQGVYSDLWFDLLNSPDVTVLAGNYTGTIEAPPQYSSISGRKAWTGSSTGFISTRVQFPTFWANQNLTLRWRVVHNNFRAVVGYNLDDVKLSSISYFTSTFQPYLSLTSSGGTLTEGGPAVTLTLSTPLPLTQPVTVGLDLSGSGNADDVSGPLVLSLPAGQTSVSSQLSAIADGVAEGHETLTLTVPGWTSEYAQYEPYRVELNLEDPPGVPATVSLSKLVAIFDGTAKSATVRTSPADLAVTVTYNGSATPPVNAGSYAVVATVTAPGFSGSSTGTLVIASSYASWIAAFPGSEGAAGLASGDIDRDGWDNAAEYTFGTSPVDASSVPQLVPVVTPDAVQLMVPPAPPGITRFVETSSDLTIWTTTGVVPINGGFQVARDGQQRFLRVAYEVAN
ncbi:MBG domain-containing protein [Haloferula sp. BvORR071]|uniref:MBG domain-containing protein n=1 Tax=Haloferula sp. BvORR071 TaxID=1396141 RepID=UPI00055605E8|nr:MBG domain-containing protein [Haloferula sp. BvORR071]